jgi:hypothetical protein
MNIVTKPFLPPTRSEYVADARRSFWRGLSARALSDLRKAKGVVGETPEKILDRECPRDEVARSCTASAVGTTTGSGWADTLAPRAVGPIVNLAPASVAAKLAPTCVPLGELPGADTGLVMKIPAANYLVEMTVQGQGTKMVQLTFDPVIYGPMKKFLFGCPVTDDIKERSLEAARPIIEESLSSIATSEIDRLLLDAEAPTTERPAGLLAQVVAQSPTAGGGSAAVLGDLSKMASAMSTAKISTTGLTFVMNEADALRMRGLVPSQLFASAYTIAESNKATQGTVIAVAPRAIGMFVGNPEIEAKDGPTFHCDTEPGDIVSAGTPVSGGNVISAFQRDLVLLRVRLSATWAKLGPAAVQFVSNISW